MLFSIQVLRFVAAMAVVVHHSLGWWYSRIFVGAAGVDVFFVISGVVIGYATPPDMLVRTFLSRRFIRVLPMYWLATLAFVANRSRWDDLPAAWSLMRSLSLVPTITMNWIPIYFPAWSLSYELAFYLVFPFLMRSRNPNILCAALFGFLAAIAHQLALWGNHFDTTFFVEFSFGLLLAEGARRRTLNFGPRAGAVLTATAIAAFVLNAGPDRSVRVIEWGIPAATLICGLMQFEGSRLLRSKFLMLGGNASYSIYLVHATVIDEIIDLQRRNYIKIEDHEPAMLATMIIASFVVGVVVHLCIERPLLAGCRRLLQRPWRVQPQVAPQPVGRA